jgi:hypothetical protein
MASTNVNAPFGFRVIRNRNGDYPQVSTRTASTSIALPEGGIGYLRTDGLVGLMSGTVTLSGRRILGPIMAGCSTTATDRTIKVCEDPDVEMAVQLSDGTVTGVNAFIGRNFLGTNMTLIKTSVNQSKSSLLGTSGTSIINTVPTGTNYRPFRGIRFYGEVGNASSQSFAQVVVKIHPFYHVFGASLATQ